VKVRSFVTVAAIGAAVVLPTGQAFLRDVFSGTQKTSEENLPTLITIAKTWGNGAKDIAPDGVLEPSVAIPMDTVPPTTIQGLG
jgi:archaellin